MAHDSARDPDSHPEALTDSTANDERKSLLNRRQYLKLGAATAATVAVGSATAGAATERHGISFDRVLNAVDDLGMDPNGGRPIDDAFYGAMENGTLIEFPEGTYAFDGDKPQNGLRRFGVRGLGDSKGDVVFRTSNGQSAFFLSMRGGSDILLENVTFDQGTDWNGGDIGNLFVIEGGLQVHDIEVTGYNSRNDDRPSIMPKMTDPNGEAVIDGFVQTGPSVFIGHGANDGAGGVYSGHKGTNTFRNCHIENAAGDGGLYTGKHEGSTNFENCFFKNNDMAIIRMGAGSYIRDSTIVADFDNAHPKNRGEPGGTIGIYFSSAQHGKSGGGVYNCDVIVKSMSGGSQGAISINSSDGDVTIKDTRIRCDVDMPAIRAWEPGSRFPNQHETPERVNVTIENVSITGSGSPRQGAIWLDSRPGSVIKNSCVHMTGDTDGIVLDDSSNSEIVNTNVSVPGRATVFNGSRVATSGITSKASCPAPNATWNKSGGGKQGSTEPSTGDRTATDDASADGSAAASSDEAANETDSAGEETETETEDESRPKPKAEGGHVLTVRGTGQRADYEFSVSGSIEANDADGTIDEEESLTKTTATGAVAADGSDSYRFTGGITDFALDGDADVLLDGETVAPEELLPTDVIEVVGSDDATVASYSFTVDGAIAPDPDGTVDSEDNISGGSAEGAVSGGVDRYRFSGTVTSLDIEGDATVRVNGTEVTPDQFGDDPLPNLVVVTGDGEKSTYRFETDGTVQKYADVGTVDPDDSVEGGAVSGTVSDGSDAYRFSGDLTSFYVDGTANVTFGERAD
ncbi:right-handed parallel beta-helix repeat-containing protein [Halomarina pelagica]|uniref:right-handed parallel beta-helix repeat-containing protein n=1 Tax=Halomarina pelagica TaxID=2961599 RepID=UPI0020C27CC6|nr:hypothetical protein [Halomarina sp. BND7]